MQSLYQTKKVSLVLNSGNNHCDNEFVELSWDFTCHRGWKERHSGIWASEEDYENHTTNVVFLRVNKSVLFFSFPLHLLYMWPQRDHLRWFIPFHLDETSLDVPQHWVISLFTLTSFQMQRNFLQPVTECFWHFNACHLCFLCTFKNLKQSLWNKSLYIYKNSCQ